MLNIERCTRNIESILQVEFTYAVMSEKFRIEMTDLNLILFFLGILYLLMKKWRLYMNQNAFFDDLLLMYLFKKGSASTNDIETHFGDLSDGQNVNNIICNRGNSTSYINRGLIDYDENNRTAEFLF